MPRTRRASALVLAATIAGAVEGCSRAAAPPSPYPTDEASLSRPLPQPVPDVVARVNGTPIRVAQVVPLAKKDLDGRTAEEIAKAKPAALRRALLRYVDRELLLQEAIARGLSAEGRQVDWAYDQMRREHPDDADWARYLAAQGLDAQRLKQELRAQQTVAALVDAELRSAPVSEAEARAAYARDPGSFAAAGKGDPAPFEAVRERVEASVRESRRPAAIEALLARLRAAGRVEILL